MAAACEVMPDHVHILVEVDPQFGVHRLVKRYVEQQKDR